MLTRKKDFTEGPLFFKITLFALPIILTGVLQVAYTMADNIVVGKFSGDANALAAVGSTGPINTMMINLLLGVAAGASVVVSQYFGAKNYGDVSDSVHTAMLLSVFGGVAFAALGLALSRPALMLLGTKGEIIELSVLYLRIICIGVPATSVYNFGAAILRATGNSKLPLYILGTTGLVNVGLNVLFVVGFGMSVAGVGIATVVSQYLSAVAVVIALVKKRDEPYRLCIKSLRIHKSMLLRILKLGLPAGIQSSMYSLANMIMINAVNTFPTTTVTAHTIAMNVDGVVLTSINGFGQSAMTFTGQNYGAKKPQRIKRSIIYCIIQELIMAFAVGALVFAFMQPLIGLYLDFTKPEAREVMRAARTILTVMIVSTPISALQDCFSSVLKGLGRSLLAMIIGIIGICGLRMLWIWVFFPMEKFNTVTGLYLSYPISWAVVAIAATVTSIVVYKKTKRKMASDPDVVDGCATGKEVD